MPAQPRSPISIATEALQARRVFGDPYEVGGITVIPVARITGGGGGAGANGSITRAESSERGGDADAGGVGLLARPIGVYVVRGDSAQSATVEWKPVIDVTRLAQGGQALLGLALLVWAWRRRPRRACTRKALRPGAAPAAPRRCRRG